jgi:tryptophan-rich hypothetical protein
MKLLRTVSGTLRHVRNTVIFNTLIRLKLEQLLRHGRDRAGRCCSAGSAKQAMNPLNPKKLLLSKWTAVKPVAKQKHFLVSRVIQPELPTDPIELVEVEAVFSKATQVIAWRELQDQSVWRQGWV